MIMTLEISYNVGLIEYSLIDISSIKTPRHICASMLNIARVMHPSTLQLSGRR